MSSKSKLYTSLLLMVAVIWGTGFIATQIAIDANFTPAFILMVRFVLSALIMVAVFFRDLLQIHREDLIGGLICGVFLYAGFILQTLGLSYSSPSNNAFITATNIVLVPFFTWMLFKKRPKIKAFLASVFCFLGVWVLSMQPGRGLAMHFGKGDLFTLGCAIVFAMHTTSIGFFVKKSHNTRAYNTVQIAVAAVLSVLYFLITDSNLSQFSPKVEHLAIIYLAVFSTCVAYFVQTTVQKHLSPSKTAVIIAMESVFASILSVLLGYDTLRFTLVFGGLLVLTSIWVIEIDFKKQWKIPSTIK